MLLQPTFTNYTALDLLLWHEEGSLRLSPKFQRRPVWKPAAKSFLIDTLLRGYPIAPIHVRMASIAAGKPIREVIDGQQRLRAVFDFFQDKFRLSRILDADWAGKLFSQLTTTQQEGLRLYAFYIYQYQQVDDAQVLEIFARLNTYSVKLNKQELRNGRYFGHFKSSVYALCRDYLEFWRTSTLFTEAKIARMAEAELVSELLILQMDGLQDKKASIDAFYQNLDQDWTTERTTWKSRHDDGRGVPHVWLSRHECEQRFRSCMTTIIETLGGEIPETSFARTPLFYSLFACVYHIQHGLPRLEHPRPARWTGDVALRVRDAMQELDSLLVGDDEASDLKSWQREFVAASSGQTDNFKPRLSRLTILLKRSGIGHDVNKPR